MTPATKRLVDAAKKAWALYSDLDHTNVAVELQQAIAAVEAEPDPMALEQYNAVLESARLFEKERDEANKRLAKVRRATRTR